jgi:3-mercaptopyruvate sulfurtransferase SseA
MRPEYQGKAEDDAVKLRRIVFLVAASCLLLGLSTSAPAAPLLVDATWLRAHLRPDGTFKSADELRAMYTAQAVTPDKTVVTYCQTHHRAAHTYFVLRLLGYPRLVGYDRSWSEWGNRDDLPLAR